MLWVIICESIFISSNRRLQRKDFFKKNTVKKKKNIFATPNTAKGTVHSGGWEELVRENKTVRNPKSIMKQVQRGGA